MKESGGPLLPYLDIPLQHAHPEVLARMGRPFAGDPRRVLDRVRDALPEAAVRTTFIVGYPGESEAHFDSLCRFVEESRFQNLGVFAYQAEEGTKAAELPDQVPEESKERRRATLMESGGHQRKPAGGVWGNACPCWWTRRIRNGPVCIAAGSGSRPRKWTA